MNAEVLCYDGAVVALPELLTWEVSRTDGNRCDSVRIRFPYTAELAGTLAAAMRIRLHHGGKRCFTGVVDEVQAELSTDGRTATLYGRGLGALLLDNEVIGADFERVDAREILRRYVTPFGIQSDAQTLATVQAFSVATGDNCLQILKGFCRHAGARLPRFAADGTLLLRNAAAQTEKTVQEAELTEAQWRYCRYGVISRQITVGAGGEQKVTENLPFQAIGGQSQRVGYAFGSGARATQRTAQQLVQEADEALDTLTLTLAGTADYEPDSYLSVVLPSLGCSGRYCVREICRYGGAGGMETQLTLYR